MSVHVLCLNSKGADTGIKRILTNEIFESVASKLYQSIRGSHTEQFGAAVIRMTRINHLK
jgi:hypothetical protein